MGPPSALSTIWTSQPLKCDVTDSVSDIYVIDVIHRYEICLHSFLIQTQSFNSIAVGPPCYIVNGSNQSFVILISQSNLCKILMKQRNLLSDEIIFVSTISAEQKPNF